MKRLIALVLVATLFGGCVNRSDQTDQVLPIYPSRYWQEDMKRTMERLQPDERVLLTRFMSYHVKTSPDEEQIPIPDGTTVRQAILAQKLLSSVLDRKQDDRCMENGQDIEFLRETIQKRESEILALRNELNDKNAKATVMSEASLLQQPIGGAPSSNSQPDSAYTINEARQQARIRYGIPELEKQLKVATEKDRQDPRWHEFQTDSPVTAAIRMRLLAAMRAAEESAALAAPKRQ